MRVLPFAALVAAFALVAAPAHAEKGSVSVSVLPDRVLVERGKFDQRLNFDLAIQNRSDELVELASIRVLVLAPGGELVSERRLDDNGDSIGTVPGRRVAPGKSAVVFNPFHSFEPDLDLSTLRYELVFDTSATRAKYRADVVVHPIAYDTKTDLLLPVAGRLLVHDGHDFYSHHRRLDVTGQMTTALGIKSNFMRYAYDFCVVDAQGKLFKGTGEKIEDWYGFGAPVYAAGTGRVVAASGSAPDKKPGERFDFTVEQFLANPFLPFGNYVVVDHLDGEFSFFAHLKRGSVKVAAGQIVKRGEKIGEIGFSGDAFLVHLHYQLQCDAHFGEGLPSYFGNFDRRIGARSVHVRRGHVDSGDVVQSRATCR